MKVVFLKLMAEAADELDGPNDYEALPFIEEPANCTHLMSVCDHCIINGWEEHDFLSREPMEITLTMPGNIPAQHPVGC